MSDTTIDTMQQSINTPPTSILLTQGADERSEIDNTTLKNPYNTSTVPSLSIKRSSCSSNSVTNEAFELIEKAKASITCDQDLIALDKENKLKISEILNIPYESIIFTPSGTDVEYLCSLMGFFKTAETYNKKPNQIVNIITATNEVGSKTERALNLQHLGLATPASNKVAGDIEITPQVESVLVSIPARDSAGVPTTSAFAEKEICQVVEEAIANEVVPVINFVQCSKTGLASPTLETILKIKETYQDKIIICADVAQMRINHHKIKELLDLNIQVFITGSKFIGAPPFCGALLLSASYREMFKQHEKQMPIEFNQYFDFLNFPYNENSWINEGLIFRWTIATQNLEDFVKIPLSFTKGLIKSWRMNTNKLLSKKFSVMNECSAEVTETMKLSDDNSIISFRINDEALNSGENLNNIQKRMAFAGYEMGRAVRIKDGDSGHALRVALSAVNIIEAFKKADGDLQKAEEHLLIEDNKLITALESVTYES